MQLAKDLSNNYGNKYIINVGARPAEFDMIRKLVMAITGESFSKTEKITSGGTKKKKGAFDGVNRITRALHKRE